MATPAVTIGGAPGTVSFRGLAPGFVGLNQVNVVILSGLASDDQPVSISTAGSQINSALLPVQETPAKIMTLPIEVIGYNRTTAWVSFSIPTGTNLNGLSLWLKIHGLRSQNQASVQLNGGPWAAH